MKHFALSTLFTDEELTRASNLWRRDRHIRFHARARDEIILPAMPRITEVTGQENDPDYLAYMLEFALSRSEHEA